MAKKGKREKNGRHQRDPKEETEWLTLEPVLRRRCDELGWPATVDNMRAVRGHEGGTLWGHLHLREVITRPMYEAATTFANLREEYLISIAAPAQRGSDMNPDGRGASLTAENVDRARAVRAAYLAADRALRASGVLPSRAVWLMYEGQEPNARLLAIGLGALVGHFGIGHLMAAE